jgi:hypothetical protein
MSNFTFSCFVDASNSSVSDFAWTVDHPSDPDVDNIGNGYAVAVLLILFFLLGVPWNLLVICSIIKRKIYTQPIIMLMLNLAVTNLLICLLIMPFIIASGIEGEYTMGETDQIRCRVCQTGVLNIILPWVSVHTLALMAVDRFIYLKKPLKYTSIVTPKRTITALVIVWALCCVLGVPPLFGFGEIKFSYTVAACVPFIVESTPIAPNYYYIMLLTIVALIPILTLFTLYVWIVCIIRNSLARKIKSSMSLGSTSKMKENKSSQDYKSTQLRLVWLFGAIFTGNIITWLPMVGLVLSAAALGAGNIHTVVYSITYLSFLSETVIHPILQSCLIRDIKLVISGYFAPLKRTCAVCCKKQPEPVSSTMPVSNGLSEKEPVSSIA